MIYLLLGGICAVLGAGNGLGAATLLRPLLDAVSPLDPASVSLLCTAASLGAALVCAFFALSQPIALHQDELLFLAIGAVLGGISGDLIGARFFSLLPERGSLLLQNALLFTLLALPAVYFSGLERTLPRLSITRMAVLPISVLLGLAASFLSFGCVPLTLMGYRLLFDATDEEANLASLAVALCAMAGKLICALIRLKLNLPNADVLLWLLPGTLLGTLAAMIPGVQRSMPLSAQSLLRFSLFTAIINAASALA